MAGLYDTDFVAWTEANAELLREGRFDEADIEHLAEEIEDLGKERLHALKRYLRILLAHLLKHSFQPGKRSTSWLRTILMARAEIEDLLAENPSLRPKVPGLLIEVYPKSVKLASLETELPKEEFPEACPWSPEQILDDEFLPG
jgi:hypothetical protein